MAALPRCALPPVVTDAVCCGFAQETRKAASRIERLARIELGPFETQIAFLEPGGEQRQTSSEIDEAGRHPHDQAAELLVLQRCEPPGLSGRAVGGIPDVRSEGEQRAECSGVNGSGEDVKKGRAVGSASMAVKDGPPEEQCRKEKAQMLSAVGEIAAQSELEEIGHVPDPYRNRVDQPGGERVGNGVPGARNWLRFRPAPESFAPLDRKRPEKRDERAREHEQ